VKYPCNVNEHRAKTPWGTRFVQGGRGRPPGPTARGGSPHPAEREFFIDNLMVRIHFIIVMIRWNGLAPWEFAFLFLHTTSVMQNANVDEHLTKPIRIGGK